VSLRELPGGSHLARDCVTGIGFKSGGKWPSKAGGRAAIASTTNLRRQRFFIEPAYLCTRWFCGTKVLFSLPSAGTRGRIHITSPPSTRRGSRPRARGPLFGYEEHVGVVPWPETTGWSHDAQWPGVDRLCGAGPAVRVRSMGASIRAGAAWGMNRWCGTCSIALRRRLTRSSQRQSAMAASTGVRPSRPSRTTHHHRRGFAGPLVACIDRPSPRHPSPPAGRHGACDSLVPAFARHGGAVACTRSRCAEGGPTIARGGAPSIQHASRVCAGSRREVLPHLTQFLRAPDGGKIDGPGTQTLPPRGRSAFEDRKPTVSQHTRFDELSAAGGPTSNRARHDRCFFVVSTHTEGHSQDPSPIAAWRRHSCAGRSTIRTRCRSPRRCETHSARSCKKLSPPSSACRCVLQLGPACSPEEGPIVSTLASPATTKQTRPMDGRPTLVSFGRPQAERREARRRSGA